MELLIIILIIINILLGYVKYDKNKYIIKIYKRDL